MTVSVSRPAAGGSGGGGHAYDVVVIGGGPAGLSAALTLVRAHRKTLVLDSNRPRNAATLHGHGYLTQDGLPPYELRKIGREEVAGYPAGEVGFAEVQRLDWMGSAEDGFIVRAKGIRGGRDREVTARAVLIAAGLRETLPRVPGLRVYYGTYLHSCIECDGYEKSAEPLAFIGDTPDVAERALLLGQWSSDVIVFTNASDAVTTDEERLLADNGIAVERRGIAEIAGEKAVMTAVVLEDGTTVPRSGGFVRPHWSASIGYADSLGLDVDDDGLLVTDAAGRTSIPGLYAAGDVTQPGPKKLIVAAGDGARVASTILRDLLGLPAFPLVE